MGYKAGIYVPESRSNLILSFIHAYTPATVAMSSQINDNKLQW